MSNLSPRDRRDTSILRKKGGVNRERALFNAIHKKGTDVASAATISLKDPSCNVTGTTTITAIASAPKGEVHLVKFTGALTLTYNATTLILPGAANITTAANDVAEFYSQGDGNWICTKYTLANGTILGVVPITKGGTGQTTAVAGKDALTVVATPIASATTTDIGAATGEHVLITGTTTITGFGTKTAGVVRNLQFDDALILTHHATQLVLPTEANITTAAGDKATMVSAGSGNWVCILYTRLNGDVLKKVPITLGGTGEITAGAAKDALTVQSTDIDSATPDLSAATGEAVTITGTTTITAFGTVTAGNKRVLTFAGALTLTHNATSLILPTAASITTAAGDVAHMLSLGSGNWKCTNYTRANGDVLKKVPITLGGTNATTALTAFGNLTPIESGLAAASTTDIANAGVYVFIVGGNGTTINSFGSSGSGNLRVIDFEKTYTLNTPADMGGLPTYDVYNNDRMLYSGGSCLAYEPYNGKTVFQRYGGSISSAAPQLSGVGSTELMCEYVSISGTTTITSFGNFGLRPASYYGIEKVVRFEGALTLTHNPTSLILPGGSNITTAAGDVAIFRAENVDGNWRCISYNRASGAAVNGLVPSNNLSDLTNAATARTNLGVGTAINGDNAIAGFRIGYSSSTDITVGSVGETSRCVDKNNATEITLSGKVTLSTNASGISGVDNFTGPGTVSVTNAATAVTGSSTTFLTSFGTRVGSGTITTSGTAVTGTGTSFMDGPGKLALGDLIGTSAGYSQVTAIASNTSCTTLGSLSLTSSAFNVIENPTIKINTNTTEQVSAIASDTALTIATGAGSTQSGVAYTIGDFVRDSTYPTSSQGFMYVWVGAGSSGTGAYLSTQRTAAYGVTNYNVSTRRIGQVLINAGSIIEFSQHGNGREREYQYECARNTNSTRVLSAGSATAWTAVLCSAVVPPNAHFVMFNFIQDTTANGISYLRKRNTGSSTVTRNIAAICTASGGSSASYGCACDGAQAIDYAGSVGTLRTFLDVTGYRETL